MPEPMLMDKHQPRVTHETHRTAQVLERILLAQYMSGGDGDADLVHLGKHPVGHVIVVLAVHPFLHILRVDVLIGVPHHGRDQIAVAPVGVSLVLEHILFGRVSFILEREHAVRFGQRAWDVLVRDDEWGDVLA